MSEGPDQTCGHYSLDGSLQGLAWASRWRYSEWCGIRLDRIGLGGAETNSVLLVVVMDVCVIMGNGMWCTAGGS